MQKLTCLKERVFIRKNKMTKKCLYLVCQPKGTGRLEFSKKIQGLPLNALKKCCDSLKKKEIAVKNNQFS